MEEVVIVVVMAEAVVVVVLVEVAAEVEVTAEGVEEEEDNFDLHCINKRAVSSWNSSFFCFYFGNKFYSRMPGGSNSL